MKTVLIPYRFAEKESSLGERGIRTFFMLFFLMLIAGWHPSVKAQTVQPGDPLESYLRWVSEESDTLRSSQLLRPMGISGFISNASLPEAHPWDHLPFFTSEEWKWEEETVRLFSPVFYTSYNSRFPAGRNDGALWQGRGRNTSFTMGAGYRHGPVEAVFRPVFVASENRDFDLSPTSPYPGLSEFAMPMTYSDIPQRFGEDPIRKLDWGESYIQAAYNGWAAGLSTQRIWTGPAMYNPLLHSYQAPGFFHTFLGTDRPLAALNGRFEGRWFWGGLKESDYFDEDPSNNLRFITGFTINYSPDFIPGLHIGLARSAVSYYPEGGIGFPDLFMAFRPPPADDNDLAPEDTRFTKTSLFLRWHFPASGFEMYTEWGRNDDNRILRDFLTEPELNRGYVLGFMKRFYTGTNGRVVLNAEITNLENNAVTAQYRDFNIWYTHPDIRQGFTHKGQVLGAPIGPGSSTQFLKISYYNPMGMAGISLGRIAHHNDRVYKNREYYHSTLPRDWMTIRRILEVEMFYGLHALVFITNRAELQADFRFGKIENRHNQYDRPFPGSAEDDIYFNESSWQIGITLRYQLQGWNR